MLVTSIEPIPVAAHPKACVCGRSLHGIMDSNPVMGIDVCLVSVLCCQTEVSASGLSLVQGSPTEFGVSECDREDSKMRRSRPTRAVETLEKNNIHTVSLLVMFHISFDWTCIILSNRSLDTLCVE
jgi:hypothetical protein